MNPQPAPDDPAGPTDTGDLVDVVVEIPAGTRNKYECDESSGRLRLERQLPASLAYPADYGFVPGTLAEVAGALEEIARSKARFERREIDGSDAGTDFAKATPTE